MKAKKGDLVKTKQGYKGRVRKVMRHGVRISRTKSGRTFFFSFSEIKKVIK